MIIHPCTCGYAKPELVYYHGHEALWARIHRGVQVKCPACGREGEGFIAEDPMRGYERGEPNAVRAWNRKVHEPQRAGEE